MSDFFSGLLHRSRQQGNLLQRRRPSRFEPAANTQHGDVRLDAEEAGMPSAYAETSPAASMPPPFEPARNAIDSAHSHRPAAADMANETRAERHADQAAPVMATLDTRRSSVEEELARLTESVAALRNRRAAPDVVSKAEEGGPASIVMQTVVLPATPAAATGPTANTNEVQPRQTIAAATNAAPITAAPLAHIQPAAVTQPAKAASMQPIAPAPEVKNMREPQRQNLAVESRVASLRPMSAPLPRPAPATIAARRVPAAASIAAPPPSTIHVSIGRIDIRATSAPAKAPRQSAAQSGPRLSLDDYLKTRDGGRR